MILITGAAGFIGSCLITKLNAESGEELILADDFSKERKKKNYTGKKYRSLIDRNELERWLKSEQQPIKFIYHLGARTDTTEFDQAIFDRLNFGYSKMIWDYCTRKNIPLVYASSAATYGSGDAGYDDETDPSKLQPLNPYGVSKNEFDKFVLNEIKKGNRTPPKWYGLKFFNVYGPNEYHKGRMASVILHAYNQFRESGKVKLFKSHRFEYKDGKQMRDFIYVKDVIEVMSWLKKMEAASGIYNLGTGRARTFYDLASATAGAMHSDLQIEWIDIPEDIRDKYQYFTEAKMNKLIAAGYNKPFYSLEDGIRDYVGKYLLSGNYY